MKKTGGIFHDRFIVLDYGTADMKFRDIDEAILDSVKEKLLEGFRNEEEFGYMAGYEPWEKLIFDR